MYFNYKIYLILLPFILVLYFSCTYNIELRNELLKMAEIDQTIRKSIVFDKNAFENDKLFIAKEDMNENEKIMFEKIKSIDDKNTNRLKEIVEKYGWPGYSLVGKEGANAAWLILQHSGGLEFQKYCLKFIKDAMDKGEVSKSNYAYLIDRILIREEKKQLYGTQFQIKGNKMVPFPIEDEDNVNERRNLMELSSLEEYSKQMNNRVSK